MKLLKMHTETQIMSFHDKLEAYGMSKGQFSHSGVIRAFYGQIWVKLDQLSLIFGLESFIVP